MAELPAAALSTATGWLLTYLLHSTVLLGGAWLVTTLGRLQPVARDFVWRVALLAGVVTASAVALAPRRPAEIDLVRRIGLRAEGPSGDPGALHAARSEVMRVRWEAADTNARTREIRVGDALLVGASVSAPPPPLGPGCRAILGSAPGTPPPGAWMRRVEEACAPREGRAWYRLLVLLWPAGAAYGLLGLLAGHRALRSLADTLTGAGPRARSFVAELGGGAPVLSSPDLSAPCVLPGRAIGLPCRCEDELADAELRAVLAHELAHVARRDVAWSAFLRGLVALLWVQPLNRLGLRRALEAAEEACDDWALARTGEAVGLATSISRVAEWSVGASALPLPVSMAGRGGGAASARVRRILTGTRGTDGRWSGILAALLIAMPLPLLPVPSPPPTHIALFVEEHAFSAVVPPVPAPGADSVTARVVVARLRSD